MGNFESFEKEKKEEKTENQKIASYFLAAIFFFTIIYTIGLTFEIFSFFSALALSILTVYTTPQIIDNLLKSPVLTYYSIFLTITLFLSIGDYKDNQEMMLLLVTHVLVCVGVFLTDNFYICHFFVFTNFYIVLRIFSFFNNSRKESNDVDFLEL